VTEFLTFASQCVLFEQRH